MKKALMSVIVASCISTAVAAGEGHSHWGYQGHEGPEHWGDMNEKFAVCKTGSTQSPIDINFASLAKGSIGDIQFIYKDISPEILNNGHTVQVNYGNGSSMKVKDQQYDLVQFHFHTPSENTVNGKAYPMEVHMVHKNDKGELAVVGVFFKEGEQNAELEKAWSKMPAKAGAKEMLAGVSLNAAKLLPGSKKFGHFQGSLTTPPCSEGVNWFVMEEPIEASREQIAKFNQVVGDNARPVQPLNGRQMVMN
ncbi:MAG: carbonic anhydrase family protein [Gammaproteobacteria bacterium]|nr:carbonic anhydrase family protein [Gammaproteobacteria bacterium]